MRLRLAFRSFCVFSALLAFTGRATGTMITIADSSFWVAGTNYYCVGIGVGSGNSLSLDRWMNYDDGTTSNWYAQQWLWMNIGTAWISRIPPGETIISASVTFSEANFRTGTGYGTSDYSIFEVPGDGSVGLNPSNLGRQAIIDFNGQGRNGNELPDWYAGHTGYGLVTAAQINATGPVTFDITDLVKGWYEGTLTQNKGQMMILNKDRSGGTTFAAWGVAFGYSSDPGSGPTITAITATSVVPEPSTWVMWASGVVALFFMRHKVSRPVVPRKIGQSG